MEVKDPKGAAVLGRFETRISPYNPTLHAPPRYRQACAYDVFIPSPIVELDISVPGSVAAAVSEAEAAIQKLNAGSRPALAPLARLLLRTESIASSKVEGMQIDARMLARAEVASDTGQHATPTALEVLGNIDAMQLAIENATAEDSVGVEQLVEIHRALLKSAPNSHIAGRVRTEQNWIGGNNYNPCGADYVPPPPEDVEWLLGDLCRFCSDDRLPPLIQAAIAHAQFETIHPFVDGNGRTGRALVQVILRRRGLAPAYVPPISVVLAANKELYIKGLTAYQEGRVDAWLEVFAVAAARGAHLAQRYLVEVGALQDRWRSMVRESSHIRTDAAAWRLIDILPEQPIVTSPTAVAKIARTKPAVNQAIEQLVVAEVLIPVSTGRRNRAWEAAGLFDLLDRLESGEQIAGESDLGPIPDVSPPDEEAPALDGQLAGSNRVNQVRQLPFTDPIYRLAPGSWLSPPGEDAEVTLRLAVAMPNVLPLGGSGSAQLVTQLRGQKREEFLIELLETSPLTAWLRTLRSTWHWDDDVEWTPTGSGSTEFTELWFAPFGLENRRPILMSRCAFATGMVEGRDATSVPSIAAAIDLMLNVHQLGGDRRPSETPHADEIPAAAALSLTEVADALGHLFDFLPVTAGAAEKLLPEPHPVTARVGAWLSTSGGLADRVIDLRAFRRIPRSTGMSQAVDAFEVVVDHIGRVSGDAVRSFVANLLYEGLERGGYRDLDATIEELRGGPIIR
jgi:Fic family protein